MTEGVQDTSLADVKSKLCVEQQASLHLTQATARIAGTDVTTLPAPQAELIAGTAALRQLCETARSVGIPVRTFQISLLVSATRHNFSQGQ
eukprot:638815-Pleurochrysis_carterae.AAC.1